MCKRDSSTANFCNAFTFFTPITLSIEPTYPFLIWSYFNAAAPSLGAGPVTSQKPLYWFICPIFSSKVISFKTESTFVSKLDLLGFVKAIFLGVVQLSTTKINTAVKNLN